MVLILLIIFGLSFFLFNPVLAETPIETCIQKMFDYRDISNTEQPSDEDIINNCNRDAGWYSAYTQYYGGVSTDNTSSFSSNLSITSSAPTLSASSPAPTYESCVENARKRISSCGTTSIFPGVLSSAETICRVNPDAYAPISCSGDSQIGPTSGGGTGGTTSGGGTSGPGAPVTDPNSEKITNKLAELIVNNSTTLESSNEFAVLGTLDNIIRTTIDYAKNLGSNSVTTGSLATGLISAPKPNTQNIARALDIIQVVVTARTKWPAPKPPVISYQNARDFLDKFGTGSGPATRDDGGPSTGDGGGGGTSGGGGVASVPGAVRCDNASFPNSNTTGVNTLVNSSANLQSPRGYIYGGPARNFTLPYTRSVINGFLGLPIIEVGPLLNLVALREIPLLQRICTAVSGLADDIRKIRVNTDLMVPDIEQIRMNINDNLVPDTEQIRADTEWLRLKEEKLDPAVRKLASEAIDAQKKVFDEYIKTGRKTGDTLIKKDANGKQDGGSFERVTFTPDINQYQKEARATAALVFYTNLNEVLRNDNSQTAKMLLTHFKAKATSERNNMKQNIELAQSTKTPDGSFLYLNKLYEDALKVAGDNAVSEYIAGNTIIGEKNCPNTNETRQTVKMSDGTIRLVCRTALEIVTPAPVIKAQMEKYATTKITQMEQADEYNEHPLTGGGASGNDGGAGGGTTPPRTLSGLTPEEEKEIRDALTAELDACMSVPGPLTTLQGCKDKSKITAGAGPLVLKEPFNLIDERRNFAMSVIDGYTGPKKNPGDTGGTTTSGGGGSTTGGGVGTPSACVQNGIDTLSVCGIFTLTEGSLANINRNCNNDPNFWSAPSCRTKTSIKSDTPSISESNLAGIGNLIKSVPKPVSAAQPTISLETKSINSTGNKKSLITLSVNDSKDVTSCMATSDWLTFNETGSYSILKESYLFKIGEIIPVPSKGVPKTFTINHPQIFTLKAEINEPDTITINNQTPTAQTNIKNIITRSGSGIIQTSSYTLDLTGIEVGDTVILTINDASLSLPIINRNAIDIIRRLITEATAGRADIKKAFSNYNFSQNGNILVVSNKTPTNISLPPTATYSLECNVDNKAVSGSVNIAF